MDKPSLPENFKTQMPGKNPPSESRGIFDTLIGGPKLPEKSMTEKPKNFSISRKDLKNELAKAYDPYNHIEKPERVAMEAEIESKREKQVEDKEVDKFMKELKSSGKTKEARFFGKFWGNLKDKSS